MYIRTLSFSQKDSFFPGSIRVSRSLHLSSLVALRPSSLVVIRHLSFVSRLLSPVVLRRSCPVRLYSRSKSTPCFPYPFLKRTPNPKILTSLNSYPASCLATVCPIQRKQRILFWQLAASACYNGLNQLMRRDLSDISYIALIPGYGLSGNRNNNLPLMPGMSHTNCGNRPRLWELERVLLASCSNFLISTTGTSRGMHLSSESSSLHGYIFFKETTKSLGALIGATGMQFCFTYDSHPQIYISISMNPHLVRHHRALPRKDRPMT
jgi:hypothetical protein